MRKGSNTPWGPAQGVERIADGIHNVYTSSHGGYHLSPERNEVVPSYMRCEDGWYEEDCDWVIVATVFPTEFTAEMDDDRRHQCLSQAKQKLADYLPDCHDRFYGGHLTPEQSRIRADEQFSRDHADDWVGVSAIAINEHEVRVTACKGGRTPKTYTLNHPMTEWLVSKDRYRARSHHGYVIQPGDTPIGDGRSNRHD